MNLGVPKESASTETRVAMSPNTVKKLLKKGVSVLIETRAGQLAGFSDEDFQAAGAKIVSREEAWGNPVVFKIHVPSETEAQLLKEGCVLLGQFNVRIQPEMLDPLIDRGIYVGSLELAPRTSRAQSMDVLSSQANIAGYRAVLESTQHYKQFFPMMMTSAGMAKPAKAIVLGAGVAGLQAIATLKRLGASVEAFDVRPEVKEQIESLGAKFMELDVGESGVGEGGYAKELSEEGKRRQQEQLGLRLEKADIIISTANIPGRKAPVLITESTVKKMRNGSVIVDMAAANGGNCPLSEVDKVIEKDGVVLVGWSNYPGMVPYDASQFFANNLVNFLELIIEKTESGELKTKFDFSDDIVDAVMVICNGEKRFKQ